MLNRNLFYLLILFIFTAILYLPIIPKFLNLLSEGNNSHGILVPLMSLWMIWREREVLQGADIRFSIVGFFIFIISILLYFIGLTGGIEFLPRVSLVMTVIGLVYFNLGKHLIRHIWFPLLFLFFTVPIPVSIVAKLSFPLKMLAAKTATAILTASAIPVHREGNMLYFVNASLEVAEACSGIRTLVSFMMFGCFFAYIMDASIMKKIVLVILTIPFSFLANLIRVTGTGLLAHFYGNKVAQGFIHEFAGIAATLLGIVFIASAFLLLRESEHQSIQGKSG